MDGPIFAFRLSQNITSKFARDENQDMRTNQGSIRMGTGGNNFAHRKSAFFETRPEALTSVKTLNRLRDGPNELACDPLRECGRPKSRVKVFVEFLREAFRH